MPNDCWEYVNPSTRRKSIASFEQERKQIGERLSELLVAGTAASSGASISTVYALLQAVRRIAKAIARFSPDANNVNEWAAALESMLREDAKLSDTSRHTYYGHALIVLRSVARIRGKAFSIYNPFPKVLVSSKPLMESNALSRLIACARKDVLATMEAFRKPDPSHVVFIEEARQLARRGLFVPGDSGTGDKRMLSLASRWRRQTGLRGADLTLHIHPSAEQLIPFLILLAYPLAANPDTLSLLRRSAIVSSVHPARGNVFELFLEKPRAGEIPQVMVVDGGTLSNGWLIRAILDLTRGLALVAPSDLSDYLFLIATSSGNISVLAGAIRAHTMQRYLASHGLPRTTIKQLRTKRLTDHWITNRDPIGVWRLSGNAQLPMTAAYVMREESKNADAIAIADVQKTISDGRLATSGDRGHASAKLLSHKCANVFDNQHGSDEHGFCASYLFPYNDVHFIFDLNPRSVAMLLRDYEMLCEAQRSLPHERFKEVYAVRKQIIEDEYLPLVDEDMKARAALVLPTLAAINDMVL